MLFGEEGHLLVNEVDILEESNSYFFNIFTWPKTFKKDLHS